MATPDEAIEAIRGTGARSRAVGHCTRKAPCTTAGSPRAPMPPRSPAQSAWTVGGRGVVPVLQRVRKPRQPDDLPGVQEWR